jgi:hypothetical protein
MCGYGADRFYDVESGDRDYFYAGPDNDYVDMLDSDGLDDGYDEGGTGGTRDDGFRRSLGTRLSVTSAVSFVGDLARSGA